MLRTTDRAVVDSYDLVLFDLDGVVYVGGRAIEGIAGVLGQVRGAGPTVAFVTNNASRTPERVADKMSQLGVPATASDIVTSAQAAARLLRDRFGTGAPILLLGAAGLETALRGEGLIAVSDSESAVALSTGYSPDVVWRDIMRAAVRVRDGLPWVATNTDGSIPTEYGMAPGHGVFVDMLRRFTEVDPTVAGKPARPLFDEAIRRVGGSRPLMVGDRLDTDIEGANNAGLDSMLVLTGVSGLKDLAAAPPTRRPTYISPTAGGLFEAQRVPVVVVGTNTDGAQGFELGGWRAHVTDGTLDVIGGGLEGDWWRVAAAAAWAHLDGTGEPADVSRARPPIPPERQGER